MLAGKAHMIVRSIYGDMGSAILLKCRHDLFEVILAADFTHIGGGEVGMHARTIPISIAERLAMIFDIDAVFFSQALQEIACNPDLIGSLLGTFSENLEFPLAFCHFSIDAFMV